MMIGTEVKQNSVGITLEVHKQLGFRPSELQGAPPQVVITPLSYTAFYPWVNVIEMQFQDVTLEMRTELNETAEDADGQS